VSRPFAAALFIKRLKLLLAEGRVVFQPRNRRKTRDFMLSEGLNEEDIVDIRAWVPSTSGGVRKMTTMVQAGM